MKPAIRIDDIQRVVAQFFEIDRRDMESPCRERRVARPRQIAMKLCREFTARSLPEIGRAFGGRDHTTVLHAVRRIADIEGYSADFSAQVGKLRVMVAEIDCNRFEIQAAQRIGFFVHSLYRAPISCPCLHCGHTRKNRTATHARGDRGHDSCATR